MDVRAAIAKRQQAQAEFERLVVRLQSGERPPVDTIFAVLIDAGRTADELLRRLYTAPAGPTPGDPCPACGDAGGVRVFSSAHRPRGLVVRRLECRSCRAKLGKQVVPATAVRRRRLSK